MMEQQISFKILEEIQEEIISEALQERMLNGDKETVNLFGVPKAMNIQVKVLMVLLTEQLLALTDQVLLQLKDMMLLTI